MIVNCNTIDHHLYRVYIDGILIEDAIEADNVNGYVEVLFEKVTNEYHAFTESIKKRIYGRVLIIKLEENYLTEGAVYG